MSTILVTGGAGYIGSHACKALAQAGYSPVAYDSLVYGSREAVRWGPLEVGDIADRDRLDEVIAHYRPEAVMHFAAYAYVGESVQDPAKYYRNSEFGAPITGRTLAGGAFFVRFQHSGYYLNQFRGA
jgi:UDP-arabinose 4-epimerase